MAAIKGRKLAQVSVDAFAWARLQLMRPDGMTMADWATQILEEKSLEGDADSKLAAHGAATKSDIDKIRRKLEAVIDHVTITLGSIAMVKLLVAVCTMLNSSLRWSNGASQLIRSVVQRLTSLRGNSPNYLR